MFNPSVCSGSTFDLNTLEAGLTSEPGTFEWYQGDPNSGGTLLTPAQELAVSPTASNDRFCAVFTETASGCSNKVCIDFTINPLPVLNPVPQQGSACVGDIFDLTAS